MDARHARPMTAYAALCAAAVVVLVQSLTSSGPVADSIARAGEPALTVSRTVTFAAATEFSGLGARVGQAIASTVVPAVTEPSSRGAADRAPVTNSGAAVGDGARQHASASATVETSKHAGPAGDSGRGASAGHQIPAGHHHAQAPHKAGHAAATKASHSATKADRHHAKAAHKAARRAAKHKR